ncbi:MAG TPA: NADH-quinone oxidoreductase subunit NuoB [Polyangiaceae bacterium]
MAVDESGRSFRHPVYDFMLRVPGLDVLTTSVDRLLSFGSEASLWIFPVATSCCGIEFMAMAASRVDADRMGAIVRGSPRHSDVMMVAGTITVKMAPRVKKLWDQMPEPKWAIAVGSCAISGDFYRDIYSVVPGIDTFIPVDVYVPGCPPNPEAMMHGLLRLQEKIRAITAGQPRERDVAPPHMPNQRLPRLPLYNDPARPELLNQQQIASGAALGWWDELNLDAALEVANQVVGRNANPEVAAVIGPSAVKIGTDAPEAPAADASIDPAPTRDEKRP